MTLRGEEIPYVHRIPRWRLTDGPLSITVPNVVMNHNKEDRLMSTEFALVILAIIVVAIAAMHR
ncbi:hypothetical protein G1C96_1945 [Bifidobacterium sp. DSM 109958]|uniref:Uncharacterized protein n=1 Tax=Bifidobacterium moraviense TaxID=2675323 RepID=A0A7Y0F3S0_9BIFI|nr:hypothetical protein [Bifidobacterium sp. DSM 109958]NMN01354.1 hypothetical protein [Bifidobacterium sp. DSM 109958]